jgi:CheY-like chemotaxis protein
MPCRTAIAAGNGKQAVELLGLQPRVDLLITNMVMPEMNGRQLADMATENVRGVKTLYTTGYMRNAIVHDGILDPSVSLLPKPFTLEQLGHMLWEVLSGTR